MGYVVGGSVHVWGATSVNKGRLRHFQPVHSNVAKPEGLNSLYNMVLQVQAANAPRNCKHSSAFFICMFQSMSLYVLRFTTAHRRSVI
jgi:hypothetical protein